MREDQFRLPTVFHLEPKSLGDDFEFVAIIAQAVISTNAFQAVDQGFGFLLKFLLYQFLAPVLNSFRYSATTRWLM